MVPGVRKMRPLYPAATSLGSIPEWSMCACVSTTASSAAGSNGSSRQFSSPKPLAALEQPAIHQHAAAVDLEQMFRSGHGARGTVKGQADHRDILWGVARAS